MKLSYLLSFALLFTIPIFAESDLTSYLLQSQQPEYKIESPRLELVQKLAPASETNTASAVITNAIVATPVTISVYSVYTFVKGGTTIYAGSSLYLSLLNVAVFNQYDLTLGPAYVVVGGKNCVQIASVIKFLSTPAIQNAIQNTPLKVIPLNFSGLYLYFGIGTQVDSYKTWDASVGIGVKIGG